MPEIVIIGAAIVDVLVRPSDERVFHTGSYSAEDICMSLGGDALNEASVLAGLGKSVRLETRIGNDRAGNYLVSCCEEKGIELPENCIQDSVRTGINVVLVGEDGRRSFLTNRNGSLRTLRLSDITIPFPKETEILCFASIFVFPHIGPEELTAIFSEAKAQGITVCADMTKCKNGETAVDLSPALAYVDYLFANEEEAALLTETEAFATEEAVEKTAEELINAGAGCVIIKCGAKGCYVREKQRGFWKPAAAAECIDTTGAGDSFVAGFLYKLSEKCGIEECAEYANMCGARAVSTIGAAEWISNDNM